MSGKGNLLLDRHDIRELWWLGVRLWYNEQDFLAAMEIWKEAIESVEWNDDNDDSDVGALCSSSRLLHGSGEESLFLSGDASFLAPLLLFLAGCYLDAGDIRTARTFSRRCLSTTFFLDSLIPGAESSDFAHQALSEYIATFQEDKTNNSLESWKTAYQIAAWAIETQKEQQAKLEYNSNTQPPISTIWTDPYQRPGFLYPSLSSKAVYTREEHPEWCKALEDHYATIRDEYEQLIRGRQPSSSLLSASEATTTIPRHWPRVGAGDHRDGAGQHDASVVLPGGDWREIVLFGSGARPDLAPKTCQILQKHAPEAVDLSREGAGEIIFSVLAPQTHIAPHCASTNLRLTAHLGLQVPDDCFIQVKDEKLSWQEGKMLLFDDSYQHEVHNSSSLIRAVLLMRFWHPNLPVSQRSTALQHVLDEKEADKMRRCNPPLPRQYRKDGSVIRHPQGMAERACPTCGRSGFETIRLLDPEDGIFSCLCGQEASL